jgi:hypothetical protein
VVRSEVPAIIFLFPPKQSTTKQPANDKTTRSRRPWPPPPPPPPHMTTFQQHSGHEKIHPQIGNYHPTLE